MTYYPDDRLTVVVLGNVNGVAPSEIAAKLSAVVHGEAAKLPAERKEVQVAAQVLAKYAGTYELGPGKFFLKVVDAQVEFFTDASGAVTHLVVHQGGRDQKAARVGDKAEGPAPRKEIQVSPRVLAKYAGTYELGPGVEVTMTVEDGRLMT